mmetsp:Transcript_26509/g.85758  ORF Transcript_26509/g.85758 Transcript_26509/m.85758 type:complete len:934 (-) Transcript_26509:1407-4208(-)
MDVYVADAKRVWVRAKLKGRYAAGERVEALIDGRPKEVELPAEEMVVDDLLDVEDLCELGHVHEASVLETVERRFKASKPYTMAGDVVLAVNPYKWLDKLYTRDTRRAYEVGKPKDAHVYAISALAARGAARGEDQSVLVSGESGAGKTESVKLVLAHLADVAAHGSSTKTIVERVLRAGPLLESFGNAATSRNGNSSRFAKFLRVEFKKNTMEMAGSWCETALLEKTRVVSRATNERAFHVFYELLALRGDYASLYAESQFELLASDRAHVSAEKARGHNDSAGAKSMLSSLQDVCGLKEDDAAGKFLSCVAAVVALGRVSFREEDDDASSSKEADGGDPAAAISDEAALKDAATLIGCDSEGLKRGLLARDVRGHEVLLRVEAASSARDALAKALYSKIFDKVVDLSNEATAADATRKNEKQPPRGGGGAVIVGMLDLFGFEFYAASNHGFADKSRTNGLPQMLINLANERLQQRFVADVLAKAQQELVAEGVPWTKVEYDDNAEVLRLLEGRAGLVDILNEECIRGASGTDANFVDKLLAFHKTHAALSTPKIPVISKKNPSPCLFRRPLRRQRPLRLRRELGRRQQGCPPGSSGRRLAERVGFFFSSEYDSHDDAGAAVRLVVFPTTKKDEGSHHLKKTRRRRAVDARDGGVEISVPAPRPDARRRGDAVPVRPVRASERRGEARGNPELLRPHRRRRTAPVLRRPLRPARLESGLPRQKGRPALRRALRHLRPQVKALGAPGEVPGTRVLLRGPSRRVVAGRRRPRRDFGGPVGRRYLPGPRGRRRVRAVAPGFAKDRQGRRRSPTEDELEEEQQGSSFDFDVGGRRDAGLYRKDESIFKGRRLGRAGKDPCERVLRFGGEDPGHGAKGEGTGALRPRFSGRALSAVRRAAEAGVLQVRRAPEEVGSLYRFPGPRPRRPVPRNRRVQD